MNITYTGHLVSVYTRQSEQWLRKGRTRDAVVEIDQYGVVRWLEGSWLSGEWLYGYWMGGVFHDGIWRNGNWYGGQFVRGHINEMNIRSANPEILKSFHPRFIRYLGGEDYHSPTYINSSPHPLMYVDRGFLT